MRSVSESIVKCCAVNCVFPYASADLIYPCSIGAMFGIHYRLMLRLYLTSLIFLAIKSGYHALQRYWRDYLEFEYNVYWQTSSGTRGNIADGARACRSASGGRRSVMSYQDFPTAGLYEFHVARKWGEIKALHSGSRMPGAVLRVGGSVRYGLSKFGPGPDRINEHQSPTQIKPNRIHGP